MGGFAEDGADAGVGVLDEGAGITVEVDRLLRVEQHVLAGIHLEDEVFQGSHAYDAGYLLLLGFAHVGILACLVTDAAGIFHHQLHQVVGIDHRSFARLHFAIRQLHHAIAEVYQFLAPLESETVEQDGEHLEVVVLLVAYHIDHLVDGIVLEAHLGGADVLGHIDRGTVGAEQQLLVESLVGEVSPYGAVIMALEESFLQTLLHLCLTLQIGLALIVYLVKGDTHLLVGLVEAGIYPAVHLLPQGTHLGITLLPLHQHLMGFLDEGSLLLGLLLVHTLCNKLLDLLAVVLVEGHVVVAYQVVALLARAFRRLTVAPLQPGEHRLADVDTTVVDDVGLHHAVAVGLHNLSQRPAKQVVANVTKMQGLVGIGAAVLNHHEGRILVSGLLAIVRVGIDGCQQL